MADDLEDLVKEDLSLDVDDIKEKAASGIAFSLD
jgi:hypothetical protein